MRTSSAIKLVNTNDPVYNKLTVGEGGNRTPTRTSVSRLAESIDNNNLLEYRPILVWKEDKRKENYVIIDGQTRYMACRELEIPFYMQEIQNKKQEDLLGILSVLNTNQTNWTLGDFAKYWADKPGTQRIYKKYLEYHTDNNVTHGILIAIYRGQSRRVGRNTQFKNGELKFNPMIKEYVEERLSKLKQLKSAAFNPVFLGTTLRKQQFQSAMLTAFNTPGFDYCKFLENMYDAPHSFNELAKSRDMVKEIFNIESL
jgi:hypothetical protein